MLLKGYHFPGGNINRCDLNSDGNCPIMEKLTASDSNIFLKGFGVPQGWRIFVRVEIK